LCEGETETFSMRNFLMKFICKSVKVVYLGTIGFPDLPTTSFCNTIPAVRRSTFISILKYPPRIIQLLGHHDGCLLVLHCSLVPLYRFLPTRLIILLHLHL